MPGGKYWEAAAVLADILVAVIPHLGLQWAALPPGVMNPSARNSSGLKSSGSRSRSRSRSGSRSGD